MKINEFISTYRKLKGYTQETLAKKLIISPNTMSQYETGNRNIPQNILESLSNVLNFSYHIKSGNQNSIQIVFENDGLEILLQKEIKKRCEVDLLFRVNNDDEYPEIFMIDVYEEENEQKEIEKLVEIFGENVLGGHSAPEYLLPILFETKEIFYWNIGKEHIDYPEYNEKFRTVFEINIEK